MKQLSVEQINKLNEPLPPEAVKPHPTKSYLSSIKPIYVVERFNEVFGIGKWLVKNEFVERAEKFVVVKSTFEAAEYGIVIPDIFGGNDNNDLGDAYKGACSDALTKIGSYLGVGMSVYKGLGNKSNGQKKTVDDIPFGIENVPDEGERQLLRNLVYSSDLLPDEKEAAMSSIELLTTYDQYQRIEYKLLSRQPGFENVSNPSQKDINKIVKQKIKA